MQKSDFNIAAYHYKSATAEVDAVICLRKPHKITEHLEGHLQRKAQRVAECFDEKNLEHDDIETIAEYISNDSNVGFVAIRYKAHLAIDRLSKKELNRIANNNLDLLAMQTVRITGQNFFDDGSNAAPLKQIPY